MTAAKCNRSSEEVYFLKECEMELARGASHIASMLHAESIHAAVKETAVLFETSHERDDMNLFLLEPGSRNKGESRRPSRCFRIL
jgi:hypothetical protein